MPSAIRTVIWINRAASDVFTYVTTPGHWPEWHPSSLGVSGATDHSLQMGEEVTEQFLVAGRRGSLTWRVIEREEPRAWAIAGQVGAQGSGTVAYTLEPEGSG